MPGSLGMWLLYHDETSVLVFIDIVALFVGLKAALGFFGQPATDEFATQGGAGFALSMIETSIGITVGLFIATLIVYPKGTQHTPLMNF